MTADRKINGADAPEKKPRLTRPGERKPGKQHYNPVNMSGREAGIVEEIEEDKAEEQAQKK